MIGTIKKFLTIISYIVWLGIGVALIAAIGKSSLPSQFSTIAIVVLLFLITYLPIKWFDFSNFKKFGNFNRFHRMKLQH